MRTLLLTTTAALFLCTMAQAQDKKAPSSPATSTQSADPHMEQRRAISGSLKSTLGTTAKVIKVANEKVASAPAAEQEKYTKIADALKGMQMQLNEQLNAVNRNSEGDTEGSFARAKELNATSEKALEGYMRDLGLGVAAPTKETPPVSK